MVNEASRYRQYGSLVFLTIQNSALILTMSYSRRRPGPKYQSSTAVFLSEMLKFTASLAACMMLSVKPSTRATNRDQTPVLHDSRQLETNFFGIRSGKTSGIQIPLTLTIPSLLYTIQNNLQFVAVSNLDPATFQIAYQGKILTTAICSVILLKKRLNITQAFSIVLLSLSIACASLPPITNGGVSFHQERNYALGIASVSISCLSSGFAGVYTEALLKRTQSQGTTDPAQLFWLRNVQLSLISVMFAGIGVLMFDHEHLEIHGFFHGYSPSVWLSIVLQAIGGLAVAFVVTYTDNIVKGFATSISVVISTATSAILWNFHLTPLFLVGMVGVLVATHLYASSGSRSNVMIHGRPELLQEVSSNQESHLEKRKAPVVAYRDIEAKKSSERAQI